MSLKRDRKEINSSCLDYLHEAIQGQLQVHGVDVNYRIRFERDSDFSNIHLQSKLLKKKKWMELFGGCKPKYPPWIPTTYMSEFYEKIFDEYDDEIKCKVIETCKDTFQKLSARIQINLDVDKEFLKMKICMAVPLPLLIFSPKIHSYAFNKNVSRVRMYYNPLDIKWKKTLLEERFTNIQELNSCVVFVCLKNTLSNCDELISNNFSTPILFLTLDPIHVSLLFSILFMNASRVSGAVCDLPCENFDPNFLFGFLKGCRYVSLSNEKIEEKNLLRIQANKNKFTRQAFLQGKRRFFSIKDEMKFLNEIPDLNMPKWTRINVKEGEIKSFSAQNHFFMFAQESKTIGECICFQSVYDLIKEPEDTYPKHIVLKLDDDMEININTLQALRLESFHKKHFSKELIPSVHTLSDLDGNADTILKCRKLISNLIGKICL